MRTGTILGLAACLLGLAPAPAADWPQWRGPTRNAVAPETGLLKTWPPGGPELAWTFDKGGRGYSGPAVVGGKVYFMGARDDTEFLIALDDSGKELWAARIGPVFDFRTNQWSRGPNATPSVDGDRVFALGSQGVLVCVDTGGKEVWRKDLPKQMNAEVSNYAPGGVDKFGWGYCWSPLVDGDKLVIAPGGPGGLLAALNKKTGEVLWQSKDVPEQTTYSSPMATEVGGVRQYVQMTQKGAVGVDARSGALLWSYVREEVYPDVVIPTPLVQGDRVYVTAWGGGAELLQIAPDGKKVKAAWSQKEIGNHQGGVVLVDGYVYGYHEERAWECQEFATGTIKWASKRRAIGAGSVVAADGMLYLLSEQNGTGLVALLEATPEKYAEKARFTLPKASELRKPSGSVWTHPVIAGGRLYLRDQEYLFSYKIK
jgi:outer membrane protein assembly factor BamB